MSIKHEMIYRNATRGWNDAINGEYNPPSNSYAHWYDDGFERAVRMFDLAEDNDEEELSCQ